MSEYPRGVEMVCGIVIVRNDGKLLLTQSPKWSDKWTFCGGHIEPGESFEEAAMREAKEETGLTVRPIGICSTGQLIGSKDYHRPAHFVFVDVVCTVIAGEVSLNAENIAWEWLTPEEALQRPLADSFDQTIKDYLRFAQERNLWPTS